MATARELLEEQIRNRDMAVLGAAGVPTDNPDFETVPGTAGFSMRRRQPTQTAIRDAVSDRVEFGADGQTFIAPDIQTAIAGARRQRELEAPPVAADPEVASQLEARRNARVLQILRGGRFPTTPRLDEMRQGAAQRMREQSAATMAGGSREARERFIEREFRGPERAAAEAEEKATKLKEERDFKLKLAGEPARVAGEQALKRVEEQSRQARLTKGEEQQAALALKDREYANQLAIAQAKGEVMLDEDGNITPGAQALLDRNLRDELEKTRVKALAEGNQALARTALTATMNSFSDTETAIIDSLTGGFLEDDVEKDLRDQLATVRSERAEYLDSLVGQIAPQASPDGVTEAPPLAAEVAAPAEEAPAIDGLPASIDQDGDGELNDVELNLRLTQIDEVLKSGFVTLPTEIKALKDEQAAVRKRLGI